MYLDELNVKANQLTNQQRTALMVAAGRMNIQLSNKVWKSVEKYVDSHRNLTFLGELLVREMIENGKKPPSRSKKRR